MGKFVIKKTASGIKFDLKATNGEVIATSEVYSTKQACKKGINSVIRCVSSAEIEDQTVRDYTVCSNPKFEVYKDHAGDFRFRLRAKNGQIIVTGEGYKAKVSCLGGIASIQKSVLNATY